MFFSRGTKVAPQNRYYTTYPGHDEFYNAIEDALNEKGINIEKTMSNDAILSLLRIYHLINNLNLYIIRRNRHTGPLTHIQNVIAEMLDSIQDQTTKTIVEMVIKEYVRFVLDRSKIPLPDYFKVDNTSAPSTSSAPYRSMLSRIGLSSFTRTPSGAESYLKY